MFSGPPPPPSLPLDVSQQGVRGRGVARAALSGLVGLDVFGEVVAPHEPLATLLAAEALLPRVRAQMPLQLVGAREALPAEQPVADERPLAGVPAQVRLQMRRLAVHLPAARYVAAVQASPAWTRSARPEPLGLLAVGTVACGFPGVATRGGPRGGGQREHRVLGQRGGADTVGV